MNQDCAKVSLIHMLTEILSMLSYRIINPVFAYFQDSSHRKYASDYPSSSIREWLNKDFYNTAFTDSEKEEINITALNNDSYYTLKEGGTDSFDLDSKTTKDKIFLLSYDDMRNSDYGFDSDNSSYDEARTAQGSDCAKCQGLHVYRDYGSPYDYNSGWILRSPGKSSNYCCGVTDYGHSHGGVFVNRMESGIRLALRFVRTSGIEQPTPEEPDNQEELCSCICHESGIKGFIWKFFHFFYKPLHINDYCKCGIVHW